MDLNLKREGNIEYTYNKGERLSYKSYIHIITKLAFGVCYSYFLFYKILVGGRKRKLQGNKAQQEQATSAKGKVTRYPSPELELAGGYKKYEIFEI